MAWVKPNLEFNISELQTLIMATKQARVDKSKSYMIPQLLDNFDKKLDVAMDQAKQATRTMTAMEAEITKQQKMIKSLKQTTDYLRKGMKWAASATASSSPIGPTHLSPVSSVASTCSPALSTVSVAKDSQATCVESPVSAKNLSLEEEHVAWDDSMKTAEFWEDIVEIASPGSAISHSYTSTAVSKNTTSASLSFTTTAIESVAAPTSSVTEREKISTAVTDISTIGSASSSCVTAIVENSSPRPAIPFTCGLTYTAIPPVASTSTSVCIATAPIASTSPKDSNGVSTSCKRILDFPEKDRKQKKAKKSQEKPANV